MQLKSSEQDHMVSAWCGARILCIPLPLTSCRKRGSKCIFGDSCLCFHWLDLFGIHWRRYPRAWRNLEKWCVLPLIIYICYLIHSREGVHVPVRLCTLVSIHVCFGVYIVPVYVYVSMYICAWYMRSTSPL